MIIHGIIGDNQKFQILILKKRSLFVMNSLKPTT
ncbi:hypothetical protein KORDIASMS9_03687 [Kordia sp. SMS9]|nr:hypothetical protein KORDIASMS9_03687 [Kordia sp. SMS9]